MSKSINKFYIMKSKLVSSTFQAHAIALTQPSSEDMRSVGYDFDQNRLIKGEYAGLSMPVIFQHRYGNKLLDVLDTGWASLFLISEKLKSLLENNQLTGWKTFPIRLLSKEKVSIGGYHGLSIVGRCGPINYNKSEIIEKRLVSTGPISQYYKGLHVGLETWDGTDFFLPDQNYQIIVTERAHEILMAHTVTNLRFQNLNDIEIPKFGTRL